MMMRLVIVCMLAGCIMVGCDSTKKAGQTEDGENGRIVSPEYFAKQIFNYVVNAKDLDDMAYFPYAEIARKISPKETEALSDEEIMEKLLVPQRDKLKQDVMNIRAQFEDVGQSTSDAQFTGFKEETEAKIGDISVMSIYFKSGDLKGTIPITYNQSELGYYIFEILVSTRNLK